MLLVWAAGLWVVGGLWVLGCATRYVPPTAEQPHATIEYRRHYQRRPGTELREELFVDDQRAFTKSEHPRRAASSRTDKLLVHPGVSRVKVSSKFTHLQTDFVRERYPCGTGDTPRTCTRTVERQRTVSDGSCIKEMTVNFSVGKTYLVELDYRGRGHCRARCIQRPERDGPSEESRPCQSGQ